MLLLLLLLLFIISPSPNCLVTLSVFLLRVLIRVSLLQDDIGEEGKDSKVEDADDH